MLENTGASERLTDGKTGFLVEYKASAVAKKLDYLMENRHLLVEVGKNASSIFSSWQSTVDNYMEIYKQELEKKKATKKK